VPDGDAVAEDAPIATTEAVGDGDSEERVHFAAAQPTAQAVAMAPTLPAIQTSTRTLVNVAPIGESGQTCYLAGMPRAVDVQATIW